MADLPEQNLWESVLQWETNHAAKGGPTGILNTPLKNLTNRTLYLKNTIEQLVTLVGAMGITDIDGLVDALNGKLAKTGGDLSGSIALDNGTADTPEVIWRDPVNGTAMYADIANGAFRLYGKFEDEATFHHFLTLNLDTGKAVWIGGHDITGAINLVGDLNVVPTSGSASLKLASDDNSAISLKNKTNVNRWQLLKGPENLGADLYLQRLASDGSFIENAIHVGRSTGKMTLKDDVDIPGILSLGAGYDTDWVQLPGGFVLQAMNITVPTGTPLPQTYTLPQAFDTAGLVAFVSNDHLVTVSAPNNLQASATTTQVTITDPGLPTMLNDYDVQILVIGR